MNKVTLTILALIVGIPGASLTWIALQRPPGRPNVSIAFLGYTNNAAGSLLARFAVSNLSASAVRRHPYSIELSTPAGLTNELARLQLAGLSPVAPVLGAGASEMFTVPSPTNQSPWRMSLLVYPDAGSGQAVKWMLTDALMHVGVKARYRIMRYEIWGDWIESDTQP